MLKFLLIPVALLFFGAITFFTYTFLNCTIAQGATTNPSISFSLKPDSPTVKVGQEFKVRVYMRSDNHHTNVFSPQLIFPEDLLEVKSIDTKEFPPLVKNWIQNKFDNEAGTISLTAGLVDPGFISKTIDDEAYLATIEFKAKKDGEAIVTFEKDSAIFSNKTNENVLEFGDGAEIMITESQTNHPLVTTKPAVKPKPISKRVEFKVTPKPSPVAKKEC